MREGCQKGVGKDVWNDSGDQSMLKVVIRAKGHDQGILNVVIRAY